MPKVIIKPYNRIIKCKTGDLLSHVIKKAIPNFPTPCGNRGFCGKCLVRVLEGKLSEVTGNERLHNLKTGERLSCQAKVLSDLVIEIPIFEQYKALISGYEPKVDVITPILEKKFVEVKYSTYHKPIPVDKILLKSIDAESLTGKCIGNLVYAKNFSRITICKRGKNVTHILNGYKKIYGFAVDIGTSKIATYLVDLDSGETISETYIPNPQTKYGDDVISRITAVINNVNTLYEMRRMTLSSIEKMITEMAEKNGIEIKNILAGVVVGNTVMISIFLGLNPEPIGRSPYIPYLSTKIEDYGDRFGFNLLRDAWIYIPPAITGFIGADAIADIVTTLMIEDINKNILIIDIGTNSEVALIRNGEIFVASAPAGPAIEGEQISCGVKSFNGAIYRVRIEKDGVNFLLYGETPLGLCGSGIISLVSEMLRKNIVSKNGRFYGDKSFFEIVSKDKSSTGRPITVTQRDLREIQKAKAAISSTWSLLLMKNNLSINDIDRCYICGSFGSSLDLDDAINIGLIPKISLEKIFVLGNAAGIGAKLMLISEKARKISEEIVSKAKFIELASDKNFMNTWIRNLNFP